MRRAGRWRARRVTVELASAVRLQAGSGPAPATPGDMPAAVQLPWSRPRRNYPPYRQPISMNRLTCQAAGSRHEAEPDLPARSYCGVVDVLCDAWRHFPTGGSTASRELRSIPVGTSTGIRSFATRRRHQSPERWNGLCAGGGQAGSRNGDNQGQTASDPGRRRAQQ
jgi:hypothetical protein